MKIYRITPDKGLNPCCEDDKESILNWLEMAEKGEILTIEILEMDGSEYAALPEYEGP